MLSSLGVSLHLCVGETEGAHQQWGFVCVVSVCIQSFSLLMFKLSDYTWESQPVYRHSLEGSLLFLCESKQIKIN